MHNQKTVGSNYALRLSSFPASGLPGIWAFELPGLQAFLCDTGLKAGMLESQEAGMHNQDTVGSNCALRLSSFPASKPFYAIQA